MNAQRPNNALSRPCRHEGATRSTDRPTATYLSDAYPRLVLLVSFPKPINQFNHQSTRGHCIMTLEVEMPHPDMPGMKQKGRVYVCDLAGTEPAGDIVYALYEKKVRGYSRLRPKKNVH